VWLDTVNVAVADFLTRLDELSNRADTLERPKGKPEENTKGNLLTPLLGALGYSPNELTFEGAIKTLTSEWVDYLLLPEQHRPPWLMVEAKSFWDKGLWQKHKDQVLRYMRDYSLMVAGDAPISWLVLTNFSEWYVLRLNDREPFWTFTAQDLRDGEFAEQVYSCFARENISQERLLSRYTESQRDGLGEQFLRDLKTWRVVLANGLRHAHPELTLEELRLASHTILLRFLFIRLLEIYGRERFYSLGTLFDMWSKAFRSLPFSQSLQHKFRDTWASYNTELFSNSWVNTLGVPNAYLELLILPDAVPDASIVPLLEGQVLGYRSIYNYDFSTLTQDILGVAYEQFLAHELVERSGAVQVLDNQETRKREGVFYTPEYIVQHIIRRVLAPQVEPHLARALTQLEAGDFEAAFASANTILNVRVVDPACGSGSFLLGAFEYLTDALERYNRAAQAAYQNSWAANGSGDLFSASTPAEPPKQLSYPHERVLVGCIYGVDLDPQAVGLAKLSLWTQLLRAHPGQYGKRGTPHAQLPALTLNIRSGNSLIDAASPVPDALTVHTGTLANAAQLARDAKNVDLAAEGRTELLQGLDETTVQLNRSLLPALLPFFADDETVREAIVFSAKPTEPGDAVDAVDDATVRAVREYLITGKKARTLKDFSEDTLREVLATLQADEAALEHARHKRPFNWAVEFPDIFDPALPAEQRGFTAVVGNPPYFNVDATFGRGAPELEWLRAVYPEIYADKTDILFYFFARGYRVLREGGELGYIVSRSFLQGDKSKKLRAFLSKETALVGLLDFLGHKVFKAGIATAILHLRKGEAPADHQLLLDYVLDFGAVQAQLRGHEPLTTGVVRVPVRQADLGENRWVLSPYREVFRKIDAAGPRLHQSELGFFLKGIDTGLDEVFEQDFVHARPAIPTEWLRPRVRISGIFPFGWESPDSQILYVRHGDAWDKLPETAKSHLSEHRKALEARKVFQSGSYSWFHLHRPREGMRDDQPYTLFSPKLFFPRRASYNRFAVDETGEIGFKSDVASFIYRPDEGKSSDLYVLCALLNSKVLNFRYRALGGLGKLTGKGMFEYFENQVGDLPIAKLSPEDETRLGELGREAHALFRRRYALMEAYGEAFSGQMQQPVSFWHFHDPAGDYGPFVSYRSPDPNRVGHLLGLRVEATERGYKLWGEVCEDDNWREGERTWELLAEVQVSHEALRRTLLYRAHHLTEFDDAFRRKQRLTQGNAQGNGERVLAAALRELSAPLFDEDVTRNLRILDTLDKRVMDSATGEPLGQVMLASGRVETEIDDIAYRIYGVEAHQGEIEAALKVVL